jgi:cell division protein FtsQ
MNRSVRASSAPPRRRSRLPWLLWLVAMLAAGGWWSLYQTTWFTVDSVRVSGNSRLATQAIVQRAAVPAGVPLAAVDTATIQAAIAEFPEVAQVRVERGWPRTVLIAVAEREPVAVARTNRGYVLVDQNGTAASPVVAATPKGLVVVEGKPGSAAMAAAVAVLAGLPDDWRVAGVTAPTQDSVSVQLRGGVTVFFGSGQDVAKKVAVAVALIANEYQSVNVSAPDAPTVK